ncbi:MAG: trypsin-like serine protease [Burkholderiales bacterium]|nr:trypsin-like serine protease [Burkholderiales bacterium]
MKKQLIYLSSLMVILSACNSGGGSSSNSDTYYPPLPTNLVGPANTYKCMPDIDGNSASNGYKIAYGNNCEVSQVANSNVKSGLESMAIALTDQLGGRYCTGTPLSYNPSDNTGYVLSAAHCVVGGVKAANTFVSESNITTFDAKIIEVDGSDMTFYSHYVNQTTHAFSGSGTTGEITAVYIPQHYCLNSEMDDECEDLSNQNGDVALIKVKYDNGVNLNPNVKLAKSSLNMQSPSYITALGYGKTNLSDDGDTNTKLYYSTYEYFGNNFYQGINGGYYTLMNGYSINNAFYSIICGGDSGGGDFYWDGNNWQLVGVHSYGPTACGYASYNYRGNDISADVRPFTKYLKNLMASTQVGDGCDNTLATENGFICRDQTN